MDPFEAAFKEAQELSSDDETEIASTKTDALEPLTMADPSLGNAESTTSKANDEEDEEEDESMGAVFRKISTENSSNLDILAKKKDILTQFTMDQMCRYEFFRRSRFNKMAMKRLLLGITGMTTISEAVVIAVSATTKLFVGDIVETARTVMTEWKDLGKIRPSHIKEAYRRLKLEGKVPKRSVPRRF